MFIHECKLFQHHVVLPYYYTYMYIHVHILMLTHWVVSSLALNDQLMFLILFISIEEICLWNKYRCMHSLLYTREWPPTLLLQLHEN